MFILLFLCPTFSGFSMLARILSSTRRAQLGGYQKKLDLTDVMYLNQTEENN